MKAIFLQCGLIAALSVGVVQADEYDQDVVKRLFEAGEIVALEQIIADVRKRYGGWIIEVEFERKKGRYLYEIEVLDDRGEVREFYYNASDGSFLKEE